MNAARKSAFYSQMATQARAGIPLTQAIAVLLRHFHESEARHLAATLEQGHPLSQGMEPAGFSGFETRLVAAGERSGRLEVIFQQLADFWDREKELKSSIIRQSLYPVLLLHFAVLAGPVALLISSPGAYLFRVVISFALLYATGITLYILGKKWWRQAPTQAVALRIPLIGPAWRAAAGYRWIQVAEIEYSAGIPLPEVIRDAWDSTGWTFAPQRGEEARTRLAAGDPLSLLYHDWSELPRDWEMFLTTGENAGKLHESFTQLVTEARRDWEKTQKTLAEWLPKIFYFGILILVVFQIFSAYWGYINGMNTLIDQIPNS